MRTKILLVAGVLLPVAAGSLVLLHGVSPGQADSHSNTAASATKGRKPHVECMRGEPSGLIALVAPGSSKQAIAASAASAGKGVKVAGQMGDDQQIAIFHGADDNAAVQALVKANAITEGAPFYRRAADPRFLSCDYKLADKPEAAPLVAAAGKSIVAAGLATSKAVDVDSPMTTISEDPLHAGAYLVSFQVPDHKLKAGPGVPEDAWATRWVVASVNGSTKQVTAVGQEDEE